MGAEVTYSQGLAFRSYDPIPGSSATSSRRSVSWSLQSPAILRENFSLSAETFRALCLVGTANQWLWKVTGGGMSAKGPFC
jgi:hypothetical protein